MRVFVLFIAEIPGNIVQQTITYITCDKAERQQLAIVHVQCACASRNCFGFCAVDKSLVPASNSSS